MGLELEDSTCPHGLNSAESETHISFFIVKLPRLFGLLYHGASNGKGMRTRLYPNFLNDFTIHPTPFRSIVTIMTSFFMFPSLVLDLI